MSDSYSQKFNTPPANTTETSPTGGHKKWLFIVIALVVMLLLGLGYWFIVQKRDFFKKSQVVVSELNVEEEDVGDFILDKETQRLLELSITVDTDGDGLSDGFELEFGFDPNLFDTDGDGINDYEEYRDNVLQLKDEDGDGLVNADEEFFGTDPLNPDTDGDGLSDYDEIQQQTDPLNPDTDGDGFSDGDEVERGYNPRGEGRL